MSRSKSCRFGKKYRPAGSQLTLLRHETLEPRQMLTATTYTPGDVYAMGGYGTDFGLYNITGGGNFAGATALASLGTVSHGQIAWSADLQTAYVSLMSLNKVVAVTASGQVSDFATGISGAAGLIRTSTGRLLASSFNTGKVYDITAGGNFTSALAFATLPASAHNMLELPDGKILIAVENTGTIYNIQSGAPISFAQVANGSQELVRTAAGKIYVATYSTGIVWDITAGGSGTPFASPGAANASGLTVDGSGRLLANGLGGTNVYNITAGGTISTVFASNLSGGLDTTLDTVPAIPTVTSVTPNPANGVLIAGGQIQVAFSQWVVGANSSANFKIQAAGADGLLGTADDPNISMSAVYNSSTNTTTLSPAGLIPNVYRLTVKSTIVGAGGIALDGDNNSTPGGDYVLDFVANLPATTGISFSSSKALGVSGESVKIADFNGDGNADVVIADISSDLISVAFGNGAGGLGSFTSFSSQGAGPITTAVADFTGHGNGILDLAVGDFSGSKVVIFRNDGLGNFSLFSSVVVNHPLSLVVGDLNEDHHPDLIVGQYTNSTVSTLLNDGVGHFSLATTAPASGITTAAVAVGDFNGDGHLDVVASGDGNSVNVWSGDGSGGLVNRIAVAIGQSQFFADGLVTGDFNNDGKLDIASAGQSGLSVLIGNGVGGFSALPITPFGTDTYANLVAGDFNSDGYMDLAAVNNTQQLIILQGTGTGTFSVGPTITRAFNNRVDVESIAAGDLNNDGKSDLAVVNLNQPVELYLNTTTNFPFRLNSLNDLVFDVSPNSRGAGQLMQGTDNAFDGLNRLQVGGADFAPSASNTLVDSGRTVLTGSQTLSGLDVHREVTVPSGGSQDFARTVEVFTNNTASAINNITVHIFGNLGSNGGTSVFKTSDGDTSVETSDMWIGTDDGTDNGGTPAIVHFIHGPGGLAPTSVDIVGDNIEWKFTISIAANSTVRLATYTIVADKRQDAIDEANALVGANGFTNHAADFLSAGELQSLANFQFNNLPVIGGEQANQAVNDNATIGPFNTLTVNDPDNQTMAVTVTITNGVNRGDFTAASATGWTRNVNGSDIVYTKSFTGANVGSLAQVGIRTLIFQPRQNAITPNTTETTTFAVKVNDGFGDVSNANTISTVTTSVNDSPNIDIQPITHTWTNQFGTSGSEIILGTAVDQSGNVYVVGYTNGSLEGTNLGDYDSFVRKLDAAGNTLWTRQFGTTLTDNAVCVAVDGLGNVYVGGIANGFSQGPGAGYFDFYVQKFDGSGNAIWTHQFSTGGHGTLEGVAADSLGNVYITGQTDVSFFGANAGGFDTFVRKIDSSGNAVWSRQFGTSGYDESLSVAVDASGSVIVAGDTNGNLNGTSAGGFDSYVRKFDTAGNTLWTQQFGTSGDEFAFAVAVDSSGSIVVAGSTDGNLQGTNLGNYDTFVRKLDGAGNTIWTRQFGTAGDDVARGVTVDGSGNIYVAGNTDGRFNGTIPDSQDAFVRALDGTGNTLWTQQFGTTVYDEGTSVGVDVAGNVYVAGDTLGSLEGANAGSTDAYVVRFSPVPSNQITDKQSVTPFAGVTISDVDNPAQTQTVTVTLDDAAKGSFTAASLLASGFADQTGGVYKFVGTAAVATTAIQQLVFMPTENRVAPSLVEDTTFTIGVNDGIASTVTNNQTLVHTTSVNDAPTINGVTASTSITDQQTATAFSNVTIGDVDNPAQTQAVTVTLDDAAKGAFTAASLTASGFVDQTGGVYKFTGTAAAATTAVRQLVFMPTENRVSPGNVEDTTFTIGVNDGIASTVTNNQTVVHTTSVNDPPAISVPNIAVQLASIGQFGTSSDERVNSITSDSVGDVYVAGVTLGDLQGSNFGFEDAFVRKLNAAGSTLWTRQFGTNNTDVAEGVAVDSAGNVYVVGYTRGNLIGTNAGSDDAFVSKFDAAGNVLWTRQIGTINDDIAHAVAVDSLGNIYVAGDTNGDLQGTTTGSFDAFLRKLDGAGNTLWTQQFGSTTQDSARSVAVDGSGNAYIAGYTFGNLQGTSTGGQDAFVRKVDSAGNTDWTKQFGSSDDDGAYGVALDASGNVYVTGATNGSLQGANAGDIDAFLRKFDSAGNTLWTKQFGTSSGDAAYSVACDGLGNAYVAGVTGGNLQGTSAGGNDAFVRKYDGAGNSIWTQQLGGAGYDYSVGVTVDNLGNVYIGGFTNDGLQGTNAGGEDAFVAKFTQTNSIAITDKQTATPFAGVTISDADNPAQTQTVTVTLDDAAKGSFTAASLLASGFADQTGGVYKFVGTAAVATTAIQQLVFMPTENRVAPSLVEDTTFTIGANDGIASTVTNNQTVVHTTSANDAPTINGVTTSTSITDKQTATPFNSVTIGDVDNPAQTQAVTVTLDDAAKGAFTAASLTASGFADQTGGVYKFTGTAADATTSIRKLVYQPTENRVTPGSVEDTTFTIRVDDGIASAVTNNQTVVHTTSVNDAPVIGGINTPFGTTDKQTVTPFIVVSIDDADNPAQTQTVTVSLDDAAKGAFTAVSLSASGFSDQGNGIYKFIGTAADATTAIRQLVFKPTENRVTPNSMEDTRFTISVDDGATGTASNNDIVIRTTSVNDDPTIVGVTTSTSITDKLTATPFTGVTIGDVDNPAQTQTVTVSLDVAAKGTFTAASLSASGFADQGSGVYKFTGTAADATTAIRKLVLMPTENRVAPGSIEDTTFTISANDGVASDVTDNQTIVHTTSVNDAPTITGVVTPVAADDKHTVSPLSSVNIGDVDNPAQTQTVTVSLDNAAKGAFTAASLTASGFSDHGNGVYQFIGTAANATTAIRQLVFKPTENRAATGTFEDTTLTIGVNDGVAGTVTDSQTVVHTRSINDEPAGANKTVSTLRNVAYVFQTGDFGFSDAVDNPPNQLAAVKISTLPSVGTLYDNGNIVHQGDFVTAGHIAGNQFSFVPANNGVGIGYASFTFQVQDDGGNATLDQNLDQSANTMIINVGAVVPTVISPTIANLTINSVTLGGNVSDDGGAAITARGVVYALSSVNSNPHVTDMNVTNVPASGTTGVFTVDVGGLETGKSYSYVAYAINSVGTTYTSVGTFTTFPSVGQFPGVTVQVSGHQLVITGDNHADQVQVLGDGVAREYIVTGLNGTVVNGVTNGAITTTAIDSMLFNLTNGADVYTLDRANLTGDVTIGGGTGNKTINIGKVAPVVIGGNVSIDGGADNDVIYVNQTYTTGSMAIVGGRGGVSNQITNAFGSVGKNLTITGAAGYDLVQQTQIGVGGKWIIDVGAGNDLISAAQVAVTGDSTFRSGTGIDTIAIAGVNLHGSALFDGTAGSGPKTMTLYSSILANTVSMQGGDGNDNISFDNNVGPSLVVNSGKGIDYIAVRTSILDNLFATLADGDDSDYKINNINTIAGLDIRYTHVRASAQVEGGNGSDIFRNIGNLFDTPLVQKTIEKVLFS